MLQQADIERAGEEQSRCADELRARYTNREPYRQRLGVTRDFLTRKGFDPRSLRIFRKNEDQGIIYVLVGERFRAVHHSLVQTLLSEIRGDQPRELESIQAAYEEAYEQAYSRFLDEYPRSALLLEVCCRKLFQEGIEEWFLADRCSSDERSLLVKTISTRINEILTPLRLNLAKERELDVFLLSEIFGKSPLVTPRLSELTLKDIEADVLAYGLSLSLFEKIAGLLQLGIEDQLEERLLRSWKARKIRSKSDLRTANRLPVYSISSDAVQKLRHLVMEKANARRVEITEKLRNLEQEWSEKRESFEETVARISHQTRKVLDRNERESLKGSVDKLEQIVDCVSVEMSEIEEKRGQLEHELKVVCSLQDLTDRELSSLVLREEKGSLERYFYSYGFLRGKYGNTLERLPERYMDQLPRTIKEELALLRSTSSPSYEPLSKLETKHLWKKEYDVAEVLSRWRNLCSDVLEPLVVEKCLEESTRLYPPVIRERTLSKPHLEEARFVGEEIYFKNRLYVLEEREIGAERKEERETEGLRELIVDNFREVVSVLIYDIRGSTFMGNRLNDAGKESDIRGNFNRHMLKVARSHGAFPVKDTGDGGILFFSANSAQLASKFSQVEGAEKFGDYRLVASAESARKALECAKDMIQAAFTFVEENLEKYQDWFADVRKESLRYAGTTYAQLPPEYKRIFKVGVGVASGKPGIDMHFGLNAFGSPDITGGLVREANFYSQARSTERSIILCDSTTLLSFLLSADEFEPEGPQPVRTHSLEKESSRDLLLDTMMNYANLKRRRRGYEFGRLGMYIERVGSQMLTGGEIESSFSLSHSGVEITKTGEFLDERERKVKVLYQVIPDWMK
jgi:class 3 adenylate cyclase